MTKVLTNPENFNALVSEDLRATTRTIAKNFKKLHKDVLKAVRNLECSEEFNERNFAPVEYVDTKGQTRTEYAVTRDGFTFLAMGFTGKTAATWKEKYIAAFNAMEAQIKETGGFNLPQTMSEALQLAANQCKQIEAMKGDVAALDQIANADGSYCVTDAAKNLGMRPKDLFQWLNSNGWIYKRAGCSHWLGYQTHCNRGDIEHKTTTVLRVDGSEKITEQVRITAQGLTKLAKLIPTAVQEVA